jgi:hypothetical protein
MVEALVYERDILIVGMKRALLDSIMLRMGDTDFLLR